MPQLSCRRRMRDSQDSWQGWSWTEESWAFGPPKVMKTLPSSNRSPWKRHPPLCHPERTRISCHAAPDTIASAPFSKERRMKFANATKFYRKSGAAEGSAVLSTSNRSPWKRHPPLCHPERTRISCHAAPDTIACAPFSKERRMKFANATKFYKEIRGSRGICSSADLSWKCFRPSGTPIR